MRGQYIRQVKRLLKVPRRKKRDILRDLEESFAAAAEHGETEQQVLDRLGTPEEFAAAMRSTEDETAYRRRRTATALVISLAVCAGAFGLRAALMAARSASLGIIGGADGPTVIFVTGSGGLWTALLNLTAGPWWAGLLGLAGILALLAAAVLVARLLLQRRKRK